MKVINSILKKTGLTLAGWVFEALVGLVIILAGSLILYLFNITSRSNFWQDNFLGLFAGVGLLFGIAGVSLYFFKRKNQ